MPKKSRRQQRTRRDEPNDKPAYAMDVIQEKPKKPEPERPKEESFHVSDSIGGRAADELARLKAQLTEQAEPKKPSPAVTPMKSGKRSAQERLDEDPNLSFADLFDPQEDDEQSFDELLKSSKLDWQYFK